jgi:glycosyltransferase involved in cell wall biosynthesis
VNASPFFSVVVPVYNRSHSVAAAIDSVLCQSCIDYEVIVVDDGSTDSTPERLAEYGDRISIVRQANAGGGPARQHGISKARGTYVAFLDSDDVWPRWTLETYRAVIEASEYPAMLLGKAIHVTDHPNKLFLDPRPVRFTRFQDFLAFANNSRWYGFSVIAARREYIPLSAAMPDSRVAAQDLHFMLMMGTMPGFVVVESPNTAVYTKHAGNLSGDVAAVAYAMRELVANEMAGMFPGGPQREYERQMVLARAIRATTVANARAGDRKAAWKLYVACIRWHVGQRRWKYLLGFPVMFIMHMIRSLVGLPCRGRGSR